MMTTKQCRARAVDWDQRAADCGEANLREQFLQMGETWRQVALQAERQETYTATPADKPIR